jgi:hypothetical protein
LYVFFIKKKSFEKGILVKGKKKKEVKTRSWHVFLYAKKTKKKKKPEWDKWNSFKLTNRVDFIHLL